MTQDPTTATLDAFRKATSEFLATWTPVLEEAANGELGQQMARQTEQALVEGRQAVNTLVRTTYEPLIEAAGAVPLSEFRRLADQVHTILLRLDRIDDALRALREGPSPAAPATAKATPTPRPKAKRPTKG